MVQKELNDSSESLSRADFARLAQKEASLARIAERYYAILDLKEELEELEELESDSDGEMAKMAVSEIPGVTERLKLLETYDTQIFATLFFLLFARVLGPFFLPFFVYPAFYIANFCISLFFWRSKYCSKKQIMPPKNDSRSFFFHKNFIYHFLLGKLWMIFYPQKKRTAVIPY